MPKVDIASFEDAHRELLQRASNLTGHQYILERIHRVMDFLGNPQNKLKVIHVAGTSGKTSTCYYIASLLRESGKRAGLSISPYARQMNERVQIDLTPLDQRQFCRDLGEFLRLIDESGVELTYFELLTAFMYWEFARLRVDWAVVETGLGGELDATNVAERQDKICVITDIGLDHQNVLGETTAQIARHKAGIIQFRSKAIVRDQEPEVMSVIRERCKLKQADLLTVDNIKLPDEFDFLPLFQRRNFQLATAVYDQMAERNLVPELDTGKRTRAARVSIPGRMETRRLGDKTVILDGAHNPQKFKALVESVKQRYPGKQVAALVAFKAHQEQRIEASMGELIKVARHVIATSYGQPSDVEPYGEDPDLVAAMCKIHGFADVEAVREPSHAWRQLLARPEPILLVTGSFYLFNHIYPLLEEHLQAA